MREQRSGATRGSVALTPGTVMTVAGPVLATKLSVTLPHEHLLVDGTPYLEEPASSEAAEVVAAKVSLETRELVARYSCVCLDNVVLDDERLLTGEVEHFARLGGGTIVDLTSEGLRLDPTAAARIGRRTGVHIVVGCGPYCEYSLAPELVGRDVEEIEHAITIDLTRGVSGTTVRAGVIGEIGVNGRPLGSRNRVGVMTEAEERGLRAAARASLRTGVPVVVHQPNLVEAPQAVAAVLEDEGLPPDRVCLGHMSSVLDLGLHAKMVARGYWIAYDNFGMEVHNRYMTDPSDERRVEWMCALLERGAADRLLVSHDVWSKVQLRAYGGGGYTHLHDVIFPWLRRRGVASAVLHQLIVDNPARFLGARPAP